MTTIKINTFLPDGTQSGELEMPIDSILNIGKFSYFIGLCRKSDEETGTTAVETIKAEIISRIAELKDPETGEYKSQNSKEKGEKLEKKLLIVCPELKQAERKLKLIAKNQLYFATCTKNREKNKKSIVCARLGDKYKTPSGICVFIGRKQAASLKEKPKFTATEEKTGFLIKAGSLKEIKSFLILESTENQINQALETGRQEKTAAEMVQNARAGKIDRDKIKIDTNDPEKIALINMYLTDIYNASAADTTAAEEEAEQAEKAEEATETTQEKQEKECITMKENTTNTAVQAETMPEIVPTQAPEQEAEQNNTAKSVKWSDCIDTGTDYQFYPTPKQLADKLVKLIDWKEVRTCLDPSAGKGDLLNAISGLTVSIDGYKFRRANCRLEAVEIVPELCAILEKAGYITENADFLEWETMAAYDAIIMNPPFRQAEKHVLKALKMLETGGQLAAIINAETIENPCTNARKDLLNKLTEYNANIEFIENAFAAAERKTNVRIAMIYVNIPAKKYTYDYFAGMDTAHTYNTGSDNSSDNSDNKNTELAINDIISNLLTQYKNESQASLYILRNYNSISELIPELSLHLTRDNGTYTTKPDPDKLLQVIRLKYWRLLFLSDKVTRILTGEARENFRKNIDGFGKYEFNIKNIYKLLGDLSKNLADDIAADMLQVWDRLTYHSSMFKNNNIHYYNGWKTNDAYKIGKKVIYDIGAGEIFRQKQYLSNWYSAVEKIDELHKIFTYLNGGRIPNDDQRSILEIFRQSFDGDCYQGQKIHYPFFDVVYYQKGTAHITFLQPELVKRWNIFAGKRHNFLPGDYGQAAYSDLTKSQKTVADSFDGGEAGYNDTHTNYNFYSGRVSALALAAAATDTPTYKPIQAAATTTATATEAGAETETQKEICFEIGKKYKFRKSEYITIISRDDKSITFAVNDDKKYTKTATNFEHIETIKNNRGVTLCWANKPYGDTPTPDPEPEKPDTATESDCTQQEDTTTAEAAETETRTEAEATEAAAEKTEPEQQQKPEQQQTESMSTDWDNIQFSQIDGLPDPEDVTDWGGIVFDDMPEFPDPETLQALPDTVPETEAEAEPETITKFEPDKIYSAVHISNSDYISAYRIIKRTAKFATIEHSDGKTSRHKITVIDGCEVIYPDGVYSMCIVLHATDAVTADTPRQAEQDYNRQQQEHTRQAVQAAQNRHKITQTKTHKITMVSGAAR